MSTKKTNTEVVSETPVVEEAKPVKKTKVIKAAIVVPERLNIRKTPEGEILDVVSKGTELQVEETDDAVWAKVVTKGLRGFAMKEFLEFV